MTAHHLPANPAAHDRKEPAFPPWYRNLVCPVCRTGLRSNRTGLHCEPCGESYPLRHGVAHLLAPDSAGSALLKTPDGSAMTRAYRHPNPWLDKVRKVISSEYFPGRNWRSARQKVLETPACLVIGSGITRYPGAIHLDLDDFPGVDLVADAAALPFADGTVEAVLCEVVLEHVATPETVISETHRVLKPGGRFFFIVPFLFPYHGHPGDYRRWTRQGLASAFSDFQDLETGIHAGPCSALVNLLSEWVYVLSGFRFPKAYVPIKGAATALLFPLKFLDFFVHRFPEAHRLAATLYITGVKP